MFSLFLFICGIGIGFVAGAFSQVIDGNGYDRDMATRIIRKMDAESSLMMKDCKDAMR